MTEYDYNTEQQLEEQIKESTRFIKKVDRLFVKYKKNWRLVVKGTVKLDEPLIMILRNDMTAEVYEPRKNPTFIFSKPDGVIEDGKFKFTTSLGKERNVDIDNSHTYSVRFGKSNIKMIIHHEDWLFPLPPKPILEAQKVVDMVNNALSMTQKWLTEAQKIKAKQILYIVGGIIGVILAYAIYKMLVPPAPPDVIEITNASLQTIVNITTNQ